MLFSPILSESMPAIPNDSDKSVIINYDLPSTVSTNSYNIIAVKISKANNNEVVGTNELLTNDRIIYKYATLDYVKIDPNTDLLNRKWESDAYYKVLLSLINLSDNYDLTLSRDNPDNIKKITKDEVTVYLKNLINTDPSCEQSEWSNVMTIKILSNDILAVILNRDRSYDNILITKDLFCDMEHSYFPLFEGSYRTKSTETESSYRFTLYDENKQLLETTDWITHKEYKDKSSRRSLNTYDSCIFKTRLIDKKKYYVTYEVLTKNGYVVQAPEYSFNIDIEAEQNIENMKVIMKNNSEEGCIDFTFSWTNLSEGFENKNIGPYKLMRSSDGGHTWEEMYRFTLPWKEEYTEEGNKLIVSEVKKFSDYLIESGHLYYYNIIKYDFFTEVETGHIDRTTNIIQGIVPYFEHAFIYCDGVLLKLKYNYKLSSFLKNFQSTKLDTMGSRYPYIARNGYTDYHTFGISAMLSINADEALKFFTCIDENSRVDGNGGIELYPKDKWGYYYRNELVVPAWHFKNMVGTEVDRATEKINDKKGYEEKYKLSLEDYSNYKNELYDFGDKFISYRNTGSLGVNELWLNTPFTNYLDDGIIYLERKYREKVEEFISESKPKLFKSPTEGNMIIESISYSITPNDLLSKALVTFSSNAVEVMENTYDNYLKYGIYNIPADVGDYLNSRTHIGQVVGMFKTHTTLDEIKRTKNYDETKDYTEDIKESIRKSDEVINKIANQLRNKVFDSLRTWKLNSIKYLHISAFLDYDLSGRIREILGQLAGYYLPAKLDNGSMPDSDDLNLYRIKGYWELFDENERFKQYFFLEKVPQKTSTQMILYNLLKLRMVELEQELTELQKIQEFMLENPYHGEMLSFDIHFKDNTETTINFFPDRPYIITDGIENIDRIDNFRYLLPLSTQPEEIPILINYIVDGNLMEKDEYLIQELNTLKIMGQLSGVFTESAEIARNYKFLYMENPTKEEPSKINYAKYKYKDSGGNEVEAQIGLNYNVYTTQNVILALKELMNERMLAKYEAQYEKEAKENAFEFNNFENIKIDNLEVELRIKNEAHINEDGDIVDENGLVITFDPIYYYTTRFKTGLDKNTKEDIITELWIRYLDLENISIEAMPGTELLVEYRYRINGEDQKPVIEKYIIGRTGKINLDNLADLDVDGSSALQINRIDFINPTYAVINYTCKLEQQLRGRKKSDYAEDNYVDVKAVTSNTNSESAETNS